MRRFLCSVFGELFAIDERALRAFRFALGLCVVLNVVGRLLVLGDFGPDASFYPRPVSLDYMAGWAFSVHMGAGNAFYHCLLLLLEGAAGLALALNWRPRLAAGVAFYLLMSWLHRFSLLRYGSDHILQFFLFWSIFLPETERGGRRSFASLATMCALLQLLIVYFAAAMLKSGPNWRVSLDALYFALNIDEYAAGPGVFLLQYPRLLRVLTAFSFYLELVGPVALLVPRLQRYMRSSVPFLFIGFHLGTALLMRLEVFPWASISCWLLYLSPEFWNACDRRTARVKALVDGIRESIRARAVGLAGRITPWLKSVAVNGLLAVSFATILYWNVQSLGYSSAFWEKTLAWPTQLFDLRQGWRMFSPDGTNNDQWWIFEGVRKNGEKFEVRTGSPAYGFAKPPRAYFEERNMRTKRFMEAIWRVSPPGLLSESDERRTVRVRNRYLNLFCRRWNQRETEESRRLEKIVVYVTEEILPAVGAPAQLETRFLMEKACPIAASPPPAEGKP